MSFGGLGDLLGAAVIQNAINEAKKKKAINPSLSEEEAFKQALLATQSHTALTQAIAGAQSSVDAANLAAAQLSPYEKDVIAGKVPPVERGTVFKEFKENFIFFGVAALVLRFIFKK